MKTKIFLPGIIFLTLFFNANAQTAKGDKFLEGTIGNLLFANNNYTTIRDNSRFDYSYLNMAFNLVPRAGYFITENFVVGLAPAVTYTGTMRTDKMTNGTVSYKLRQGTLEMNCEAFLRFYFRNFNVKNRLYIQPGIGVGFNPYRKNKENFYDANGELFSQNSVKFLNPTNQVFGELLIGYNYFFNQRVAFNTSLGYSYFKRTISYREEQFDRSLPNRLQGPKTTVINESSGLAWNLGLTFFFIKEKK
jgi:outer membrane protein W